MNREYITQLEEAFYRYLTSTDSWGKQIAYPIAQKYLVGEINARYLSELLAANFRSHDSFSVLHGDDYFFVERTIFGLLAYMANDHRNTD